MSSETISREAKLLIQLGTMGKERNEVQSLLREARDQCHKLRRERFAAARAYEDVCQQLDEARETIRRLTLEMKEEY